MKHASESLETAGDGLRITACIVDIDATVTNDRTEPQMRLGPPLNNAVLDVLAHLMADHGWNLADAREALARHGNETLFWDYPDFIKEFHLPEDEAWARLVRWHSEHIIVYHDAVKMVRRLHAAGLPLFIVSNNPLSGCFLKLHRAGLSGLRESKYFRGIFGSNVCMGQKYTEGFWRRSLERTGFAPSQLAMVGDNPKDDCEVPRALGVETVFLVDRKQTFRVEKTPEAFRVNTLEAVPEILFRQ